jgi:hypothetical protein
MTRRTVAAGLIALTLAGCEGFSVGPQPQTFATEMTAANPMAPGAIDDATGSMIP